MRVICVSAYQSSPRVAAGAANAALALAGDLPGGQYAGVGARLRVDDRAIEISAHSRSAWPAAERERAARRSRRTVSPWL
jgi:hypothetical protein